MVEIYHVSYPTKAQKYLPKIQSKLEAARHGDITVQLRV